ncbi:MULTISPECIES: tyrosine-type recombinase/integrase [Eubacterium]|uniref:tyrosine-type recombinase/integrase n=1 Tax=Eubacterium TaxID=1730 RepID=UPI0021E14E15|nr:MULTISPECIES: tyrosine-type recombinase/integrase [Eubacterium]
MLEDDEILRIDELADKRNKSGNPIYLYGYLIVFLIHTGLRRGELFALKWEDVDLENRVVNVNKSMVRIRDRSVKEKVFINGRLKVQKLKMVWGASH